MKSKKRETEGNGARCLMGSRRTARSSPLAASQVGITIKTDVSHRKKSGAAKHGRSRTSKSSVAVNTSSASVSTTTADDKCFNREKLKHILKCLADQQKQAKPKGDDRDGVAVPEIFNRERLKKIKTGLLSHVSRPAERSRHDDDNDSDCCVIFDGKRRLSDDRLRTVFSDRDKAEVQVIDPHDDDAEDSVLEELSVSKRNRRSAKKPDRRQSQKESERVSKPVLVTMAAADSLKKQMVARLKAARFRYINEKLYTSSGADAQLLFSEDPDAYDVYHSGYQTQLSKWPVRPLDVIIKDIKNMPKSKVIADFGCGDAKLSRSVANKVHSFDLVALNDRVHACNMDKVPLRDSSVDVVVFCLSLMGIDLPDYIAEANRVLKTGGLLKIAEVRSRFNNVHKFREHMNRFGFKFLKKDATNKMFILMDFKKTDSCDKQRLGDLPRISLQPCMYKKR